MTIAEETFHKIGAEIEGAEKSSWFGKPCYKIGGKPFVAFFQEAMVFKLGAETNKDALSLEGAQLFDPSGKGRAMREWVQVPDSHKAKWMDFAKEARNYVQV